MAYNKPCFYYSLLAFLPFAHTDGVGSLETGKRSTTPSKGKRASSSSTPPGSKPSSRPGTGKKLTKDQIASAEAEKARLEEAAAKAAAAPPVPPRMLVALYGAQVRGVLQLNGIESENVCVCVLRTNK